MSDQAHLQPYVLEAEDVPSYWQVGILWNVLLSAEVTAGQFCSAGAPTGLCAVAATVCPVG